MKKPTLQLGDSNVFDPHCRAAWHRVACDEWTAAYPITGEDIGEAFDIARREAWPRIRSRLDKADAITLASAVVIADEEIAAKIPAAFAAVKAKAEDA